MSTPTADPTATTHARRLGADDGDLSRINQREVAVIGFGPRASAHALNLRDSGVDVRIGLPQGRARRRAEAEGLYILEPAQAVQDSDVVVLLSEPEHELADLDAALPHLREGDVLVLGRAVGAAARIATGQVRVPAGVDVVMVADQAPGDVTRAQFVDGRGVPALVGIIQDASGEALPIAAAYAGALGCLRAGSLVADVAQLARAEAFSEAAVQGGAARLVEAGFDALVEAGVAPEVAYLTAVHALKERVDRLHQAGPAAVAGLAGTTAAQRVVPDATRQTMAALLRGEEIADAAAQPQSPVPRSAESPMTAAGERVRALMGWLRG